MASLTSNPMEEMIEEEEMKEKSVTGYRRSWSNPGPDDLQRPNTLRLCSGKIKTELKHQNTELNILPASSSISLTTPASPGDSLVKNNKLDNIKRWTISTYKCSRQTLYKRLGKTNKTVDVELEGQIEKLRDTREKYENILRLSRALTSHFYHVVTTQSSLGQDNHNQSPS